MQAAESAPSSGALARGPTLPVLGGLPYFIRDPLSYMLRASKAGRVVDLRFPRRQFYLFREPEDIEHVLVKMNRSVTKDMFLRDLQRVVGTGLLTSEGDFWRRQRRLAQPAFHRDRIAQYATQMVSATSTLVANLRDGETRDVNRDLMKLTLDIVMQTLFGATVEDEAPKVTAALDAIMHWYASPLPLIVPAFDRLPLPPNWRLREAMKTLNAIILRIIETRRKTAEHDRGDLLSMLLLARDEDGSQMTDAQLRDEAITLFLAGHETTANALTWTLVLLAQNPAVDRVLTDAIAFLDGRAPTLDDLPKLAFVEHVATESMRLYPPAWAVGREVSEPFELHGIAFRPGAQLIMPQWVTHRDPRYFDDPERFRPSRWADGLAKRIPRYAYFPFGGGPRLCIGNAFAMMELILVLTTLAQRFRFEVAPGQRIEPLPSITLRPRAGLRMVVRARRSVG